MAAGAFAAGNSILGHGAALVETAAPANFDFVFLTDTHIQPELAAADGCAMAFKKVRETKADFVLQGGDHVFDAMGVDRQRADSLFDLYARMEHFVEKPVRHTIGNHDQFGLLPKSGVSIDSPGYGKQLFRDRVGPTYYSFDHKGYHFIVLDTVQPTPDRSWEARIDDAQLEWLTADLAKLAVGAPVIVAGHVPLVTAASEYAAPEAKSGSGVAVTSAIVHPQLTVANAWQVLPLLEKHNVLAVFQGAHPHQ